MSQSTQSPGIEYAKQEIERRVENKLRESNLEVPFEHCQFLTIVEYFAEHLEEIYGKFEAQQQYNHQLEEHLRVATEAIKTLNRRISRMSQEIQRQSDIRL